MHPMERFDRQPHLSGELLELRPLRPADWEELYAVAADPLIWEMHPARDRYQQDVFREFFRDALASGGALVAVERNSGRIIGSSRYFWHDEPGELEIGWTFLARAYWGGVYNAEMKRLMLDYALKFVDHVIFVVGVPNLRSRKAMQKIGGVLTERRIIRSMLGIPMEHLVFEIRGKARAAEE